MIQDFLYSRQRNPFLERQQHMGRHVLRDLGAISHAFNHFLHLPRANKPTFMDRKVMFQQGLNAFRHRHYPLLGLLAIGPAFAGKTQCFLLLQHLLRCQLTQL